MTKASFSYFASHLLPPLALTFVAGCYQLEDATPPSPPRFVAPAITPLEARLERATSCADLTTRLRADAIARVEIDAWQLASLYVEPTDMYGGGGGGWDAGAAVGYYPGAPGTPPVAVDGANPDPTAGEGAPSYTETNTQVAGVDEADFVETDGTHLYLLHGTDFHVIDAAPLGTVDEGAHLRIEGSPSAMFVANGRAVVFSSVGSYYGYEWGYPYPGLVDGGTGVVDPTDAGPAPDPAVDAGAGTGEPDIAPPYWNQNTTSEVKITVIDVTGASPVVVSERYIEGNYVDARRHGDVVRVVVQSYGAVVAAEPPPSGWDPATGETLSVDAFSDALVAWRDRQRTTIASAPLDAFLPSDAIAGADGRVAVEPDCGQFYVPPPGTTNVGMVTVLGFSMSAPTQDETTTIAGRADVVYANHDVLALAQHDYRWDEFSGVSSEETALHTFTLAGLGTDYEGSGKVLGSIRNAFSLDEKSGVLRVVTTESHPLVPTSLDARVDWFAVEPRTHVTTLARAEGTLTVLGTTPPMAPGETVQAVRFLGDSAYVVTFRQVDPLFVVDLSQPATPTVVGELHIPGFSTYIHELDATHLLTIGRDTDAGGFPSDSLALQIFDVGDPTAPTLVQKLLVPMGSSTANWDHHAFVFDTTTGLLAIPVETYGTTFESRMNVYSVSVTEGFALRGSVSHTAYFADCVDPVYGYYTCGYTPSMRRGLFLGSHLYSISYGAVTAHALTNLTTATDVLSLPAPVFGWGPIWY